MPAPRRPARRSNTSHLMEAIQLLLDAETALGRVADADLNPPARIAVAGMKRSLGDARRQAADAVEAITDGALHASAAPAAAPLFLDARRES